MRVITIVDLYSDDGELIVLKGSIGNLIKRVDEICFEIHFWDGTRTYVGLSEIEKVEKKET